MRVPGVGRIGLSKRDYIHHFGLFFRVLAMMLALDDLSQLSTIQTTKVAKKVRYFAYSNVANVT